MYQVVFEISNETETDGLSICLWMKPFRFFEQNEIMALHGSFNDEFLFIKFYCKFLNK